jgi:hypothetical protein
MGIAVSELNLFQPELFLEALQGSFIRLLVADSDVAIPESYL